MVRSAVTVAIADVEASTGWYGRLLDCASPLDPEHDHRGFGVSEFAVLDPGGYHVTVSEPVEV